MAKIYLICGKICSGKSTYSEKLCAERSAALLSVDELLLALFDPALGESHDEVAARAQEYLYGKAGELCGLGVSVVLDWGFWTQESRRHARDFCARAGLECELHYLRVSDEEWERRIERRNMQVRSGGGCAYFVDDGLKAKFRRMFQEPGQDEVDIYID